MINFVGVDPGKDGAVAILRTGFAPLVFRISEQDETCREIHHYLHALPRNNTFVAIEDLHAIFKASAGSTFSLGWSCGYWHGVFDNLGMNILIVRPEVWQMSITKKPERPKVARGTPAAVRRKIMAGHKKALKAESIRTASELFPMLTITHDGVADALCIAAWRRYMYLLNNSVFTEDT